MCPRSRPSTAPRWPFWLLLVGWFCANSPQAATYALLGWMAEARSFTHQHRLTAEVAALLGGERGAGREAAIAKSAEPAAAKPSPAVPPDAVLKKLPLAFQRTVELLPPARRAERRNADTRLCPDSLRAAPPHGPPRFVAA